MNAIDKIKSPKLIKFIIDEIHSRGVIGEEESSMALMVKIMLRLVKNAHPASSNVLVSDTTGGGKDFLTNNVCEILCKKDETFFHRTALSEKVLNYWQPKLAYEKNSTWDGKVLYLEDPEADLIKSQAFKVMASGGTSMTVLKDQKVYEKKIYGKPVIVVTSMKTQIDDEGQRRWDAIRIDNSDIVSKKVVNNTLAIAAGNVVVSNDEVFCSLLQGLQAYEVVVPYAIHLAPHIDKPSMIDRTQINKLLDYIKASAILHQEQRKVDAEGRLIAEVDDYEVGRAVYTYLRDKEGNALNRKEELLLDYLRSHKEPRKLSQIITDMEQVSKRWLYENKEDMISKGVISSITKFDASANKEVEHLKPSYVFAVKKKDMPPASEIFKANGYISKGELYRDINEERKQKGLKPIFNGVI